MRSRFSRSILALTLVAALGLAPATAYAAPPTHAPQESAQSGPQLWMSWAWSYLTELLSPLTGAANRHVSKTTTSPTNTDTTSTPEAAPVPPPPDPPSGGDTTPGIDPDG